MQWIKRAFLFIAINSLVILTISLILSFLHIKPYLTAYGMDYQSLLVFCFIWGMIGAFISLLLSRKMAKWMLKIRIIDPKRMTKAEEKLWTTIQRLARAAGLPDTPEVGIFSSPSLNALATGPTKRRSLVAVSTGLVEQMNDDQIEAVLGHEISHIANGDMVTMTLIQGIVNAFVMFLARALAFALSVAGNRGQRNSNRFSFGSFYLLSFLFEIFFMIFGSMVIAFFSRIREYRADRGGAMLSSREKMISALQALAAASDRPSQRRKKGQSEALQALMIARPKSKFLSIRLFATHPPLEERIQRLQQNSG
ncbi:MAG: protease HtpX [Chlamydiota bacterium]